MNKFKEIFSGRKEVKEPIDYLWRKASWDGFEGMARHVEGIEDENVWEFSFQLPDADPESVALSLTMSDYATRGYIITRQRYFEISYKVRDSNSGKLILIEETSKLENYMEKIGWHSTEEDFERAEGIENIARSDEILEL